MLVVMTTTPDRAEAERLADLIIGSRLAGCVQILPQMTSVYIWEGVVQKEPEHLLLIKTLNSKFEELRELISKNHSYEIPEIVGIPTETVSGPYHQWLESNLTAL